MFDDDGETAIEHAVLLAHPGVELVRRPFPDGHGTELSDYVVARIEEDAPPHFLVVSRGFTELTEKIEEDPDLSGWGFELTCRLPSHADEGDMAWAGHAMQSVSRYLADKITFLEAYNYIPITDSPVESTLAAVLIVDDVVLRRAESENGRFAFFQMVGLTADEHAAVNDWDAASFLEQIRERDPFLLTDPKRGSRLADPEFARHVNEGRERDGSSVGVLYGVPILWRLDQRDIELHLSTDAVPILHSAMRGRLAHGNPMYLYGDRRKSVRPDGSIAIRSQVNVALHADDGVSAIERADGTPTAVIRMSAVAIKQLVTILEAKPGTYVVPELVRVRFVVVTPDRFREPGYRA